MRVQTLVYFHPVKTLIAKQVAHSPALSLVHFKVEAMDPSP
jgi:hypothetical protein